MNIKLSEHFNYGKLFRFVIPSIIMMVFTSIYSVVDGFFVSNFVGKTSFAAVNLVMPVFSILSAFGMMIGAGGTAIVGKTLGEKENELANKYFSMFVFITAVLGIIVAFFGFLFIRPLAGFLRAEGQLLEDSVYYGRIVLIAMPFQFLQMMFQSFFITAEKPHIGLAVTVTAGVTNIILDALFIAVFKWGLFGAAFATSLSETLGALISIIYFARKNTRLLRLTAKTKLYGKIILKAAVNGSSEMINSAASSIVSMLFNYQLMRIEGENGVAAYGAINYIGFIFAAIFFGYAMGCAPIISYNFGADNTSELKNMFKKSMIIMTVTGIIMFAAVLVGAQPLSRIFVGYDKNLYNMTVHGFHICAVIFTMMGVNTFASGFFTALNDGKTSAIIAFLRTFLFQAVTILILPALLGLDGVWWAIVVAELMSIIVAVFFLIKKRSVFHYA